MAQRVLPGAYVTLNDMSQLPEGPTALTVGYVLQANRGPLNELTMVTSPADFLAKFTFDGKPSLDSDPTYWSILKVLARTNVMYVSRAAHDPLYGGAVLRKAEPLGALVRAENADNASKLYVEGTSAAAFTAGKRIMITGTTYKEATGVPANEEAKNINGYYVISSAVMDESGTQVVVTLKNDEVTGEPPLPNGFAAATGSKAAVATTPAAGITSLQLQEISRTETGSKIILAGETKSPLITKGCEIVVKGTGIDANDNKVYKVEEITDDTTLTVTPSIEVSTGGAVYACGITNPDNFMEERENDDGTTTVNFLAPDNVSMIITGINPGAYNGDLAFDIISSVDNEDMVYKNTMTLNVRNSNTGDVLESFTFSLDPEAKDISGNTLYVDEVVAGSAYIKIYHGEGTDLPSSSITGMPLSADGGSNGGTVTAADMEAALEPFRDKVVSVSILGNGCSTLAENIKFQQALMGIADERKDCFVFLNNPKNTEKKTLNSEKAQAIVDYKKGELANTSFYGCMYAPHVNTSDIYNGRDVKIGSEAVAIAGWLGVIDSLSYPYAYAGPRNGLVQGVTCDWKIGDMSGEAQILNDASINYVAYDGKVGRYYMQCQNTLQVANSSMRNIGTVLNVLDIKEHFVTSLKEYLQLPITDLLRKDIVDTANDYLSPMEGVRFYNYLFQDVSSDFDIADNTLRYLLTISPTAYAQKIYLVMNIVNATFDFSILQSL